MPVPDNGLLYSIPSGWVPEVDPKAEVIAMHSYPVPYASPKVDEYGNLVGVSDITQGIEEGWPGLYNRKENENNRFYRSRDGGQYLLVEPEAENVNMSAFDEVPYSQLRKALPKRDYIGGDNYRVEAAKRIPGLSEFVYDRAKAYGVDPNLMMHRLMREGFIDQAVGMYNESSAEAQKNYWSDLWNQSYSGFGAFGLDDAGSNLMEGKYTLQDENAHWMGETATNEKGRDVQTVYTEDLKSMLEILAAEMAYRQGEVKKRYNPSDADLGTYTNAAFNMGLNNARLGEPVYVRGRYAYPNYYRQYGLTYSDGGKVLVGKERIAELAKRLKESGYEFADGGNIHIKPSHEGLFTAKAKAAGQGVQEYASHVLANKEDYPTSTVKQANFAKNAVGWKHADGGLLHRFDDGTPGVVEDGSVDYPVLMYNQFGQNSVITTPVDFVTESGPYLQLDADSLYGGEIEPAVMIADAPKKEDKKASKKEYQQRRKALEETLLTTVESESKPKIDNTSVAEKIVGDMEVDNTGIDNQVMDAMVHNKYERLKKLNTKENEDAIKALQRRLVEAGYDLGTYGDNKDGVDGKLGAKTIKALKAWRNEKQKAEYGKTEDPLPVSNFLHGIAQYVPGLNYFVPQSFRGTMEQARDLGYKTFIDPEDGVRKSVQYPVTLDGIENPTKRDIAAAQMKRYGITGDFTSDKSKYQQFNYAYLPAYGYNFLAPFSNKKNNLPVADPMTGRAVRLGADRFETFAEKAKDWYNDVFGKNVTYSYQDASPSREDYRNLYFGYPQRNGTLMVNENVDRMNSGEFRTGYAFVPKDTKQILRLADGIKHDDGVAYTSGHQLGNFGYGRNAEDERWYYDDWDLIGDNTKIGFSLIGGKPFQVYDRDSKKKK